MQVLRHLEGTGRAHGGPFVVTLGIFDGVHRGHQAVIARTVERAGSVGGASVVLTFDPHPAAVLSGEPPPTILPVETRLEAFEALGVDEVRLVAFDRDLARTSREAFAEKILLEKLGAKFLVLGYDTRFGMGRRGDATFLRDQEPRLGFAVEVVEPVLVQGEPVKSTRIREAIRAGELTLARELLGRPASAIGRVVRGAGRGAGIGFPTANLEPRNTCLPPPGVYATRVRVGGLGSRPMPAATNVGTRPTFESSERSVIETHLLDESRDLYGAWLVVEFIDRIREERRFESPQALAAQIEVDLREVAARLRD